MLHDQDFKRHDTSSHTNIHVSKVHIYINIQTRARTRTRTHTHSSRILVQFSSGIRTCAIIHLWFSSSVSPLFVISSNTSWESIWCLIVKLLDGWFFRRSPALWSIRFHEYLFPAASAQPLVPMIFPISLLCIEREKKKKMIVILFWFSKWLQVQLQLFWYDFREFSKIITRFGKLSHEWFSLLF